MPRLRLSKTAINQAILQFEVSWSFRNGFDFYNKNLSRPTVPDPVNTDSGVTIGFGYDCGQVTAAQIRKDWTSVLPQHMVEALVKTAGLKKQQAVNALPSVNGVVVPADLASLVFYNTIIPRFSKLTYQIFPSIININPVEQAVFVGLVYNRGASLDGNRRKEMRGLVKAIERDNDVEMAKLVSDMQSLWPNTRGLRLRRTEEARLIALKDNEVPNDDILIVEV